MSGRYVMSAVVASTLLLLLGAAGPAVAADTVIATLPQRTPIDALGGHVLWSVPDDAGRGWRLIDYSQGVQHRLPVAASPVPFDVDLGRDRRGRLVVVYSRCREPLDADNFGRRGCDLFRYDLATARERKITAVSSRFDEYEPTLWGARIAFVRAYVRRGRSVRELIYVRRLRPDGDTRRLRGGRGGAPLDLDLRSRTVAVRRTFEYSDDVRAARAGRRGRILLSTPGSGAAAQVYSTLHPTFADPHTVYWGLASSDPDWSEVWRRDVRTRRVEHATTRIQAPFALFAQDGDTSYYALETDPFDQTAPLELHRLDGLAFEKAPELTLD
jgi:hypothetical protein